MASLFVGPIFLGLDTECARSHASTARTVSLSALLLRAAWRNSVSPGDAVSWRTCRSSRRLHGASIALSRAAV